MRKLLHAFLCAGTLALAAGTSWASGGGTLSPLMPILTYTFGPVSAANPTPQLGAVGMEPTCDPILIPNGCDDYALTVDVDASHIAANPDHRVMVKIQWPNAVNDFDLYVQNPTTGTTIQSSASSNDPEIVILTPVPGVTQYRVRVVCFSVVNEAFTGTITLGPLPTGVTPTVGAYVASADVFTCNEHLTGIAGLFNHGNDGEPAIDFDRQGNAWIGGIAGVGAGIGFWKVPYYDECATDPVFQTIQPDAGVGGGDVDIEVAPAPNALGFQNIYATSLTLANVTHATSSNGGATWVPVFISTPIPVNDRQWNASYGANMLLMSWQEGATQPGNTLLVTRSNAGGAPGTFIGGFPVYTDPPVNNTLPKQHGQMVFDQRPGADEVALMAGPTGQGTAYHPFTQGPDQVWMAFSRDFGTTWHSSLVYQGGAGDDFEWKFTWAAVDQAGNVYICWGNHDGVYYSVSTDIKTSALPTWRSPVRVSNGVGSKSIVLPMMDAGSAGRLVFAWYGSSAANKDVSNAQWRYYHARTNNALDPVPVIEQLEVSDAVVHTGAVCLDGFSCPCCRELLECQELAIDPTDGSSLVSYAGSGSRSGPYITRQVKGVSAIDGKVITDRSGPCPTLSDVPPCQAEPPPPEDVCTPPGVTMFTDPPGDFNTTTGSVESDIRSVSISEPHFADGVERIVFTMTVESLDPGNVPPNRLWRIYFIDPTDGDSTFYVSMNTCLAANLLQPSFDFGFRELTPAGSNLDRGLGAAEAGAVLPNGEIRITMRKSQVGNNTSVGMVRWYVPIGVTIYGIQANTFLLAGANCSGSLQPIDDGSEGAYTAMGNCLATATTVARFEAARSAGGVRLQWTAHVDGDITGWNVYRGTAPEGVFERLNAEPIAAGDGGEFEFEDATAPASVSWYRLNGIGLDGGEHTLASTRFEMQVSPLAFEVALAGANPFRGATELHYVLPARERVRVEVFNVSGRRLATLVNRDQDAGAHSLPVNLRSARGGRLGAGIYMIRVTAGSESRTLRLVALE